MDAAFVKKEAKWYQASLRYDNLSRLPPDSLSESNPDFKQALHDYYYITTDEGLKSTLIADHYSDPWPETHKRPKPKKRELTPDDEDSDFLTAGVPPKDREAFNAELRSFMLENCPDEIEELPNPIVAKASKAEKAKKAVVSREKRAAAKARSIMPPTQHTRNTRLRAAQAAQAAQATTADADGQAPNGGVAATQDGTAVVAAPDAEEGPGRSRQRSAPPFNSFMRDTRAAMTRNAFMSRPVRGVVSNSYYAALNNTYPKPRSVGDEPIGNDIPRAPANGQEPAASKPDAPTTVVPKNTVAPKKSIAHKPVATKTPAPKKSAAPKTTASKPTAPKNPTATQAATNKAASIKPINGNLGKDKSPAIKLPRAAKACDPCRSHKTRCTGGTPCDACRRRGFNCVYAPDGRKAPMKRAREDSQEVVKKEPLDKDAEQESRPAKRARKLKVTSAKDSADSKAIPINSQLSSALPHIEEVPEDNAPDGRMASAPKKRAREDNQEAVTKEPLDKDTEQESRPAKRVRKLKITSTKKDSANSSDSKAGTSNAQLSSILPSIEEVPEDKQGANAQLSKMHCLSQPKVGKSAAVQPTKIQSSYSGRITRSRSRQLSEEAEAQAAKLQHKGKRAREETQEPQERPAKLQRATRKGPNWRKPDGNPEILRAIDSMRVDSEGNAQTDDPWIGFEYEATWMSNTYTKWENSFDWPNLNFHFKQEESFHARPSIKLVMTDVLKGILVDDWEHVTKDSQLVPLPHEQPVVKILNDYLEDEMPKREEDSAQIDILKETMAGLREYFDRALGRILLYR